MGICQSKKVPIVISKGAVRDISVSNCSNSLQGTISVIYLYLKTHNVTGLKYLGKTVSDDPHSYPGSGKVWRRHIEKHGYDVTTEILLKTDDPEELRDVGMYYSNLWNIVESKEFANLIPEMGDGGAMPWHKESRQKLSKTNTGRKHTDKARKNFSDAQQKQAAHLSKNMKEYLSIPENYEKRYQQLTSIWNQPGHHERMSEKMSMLHWCNDGIRNYRKNIIPTGMIPGRLKSQN
jgi:hypothetical protein